MKFTNIEAMEKYALGEEYLNANHLVGYDKHGDKNWLEVQVISAMPKVEYRYVYCNKEISRADAARIVEETP